MHGWGHADINGEETVAAWACGSGCPVAALDAQNGLLSRQGSPKIADTGNKSFLNTGYGGGASRFFRTFGG